MYTRTLLSACLLLIAHLLPGQTRETLVRGTVNCEMPDTLIIVRTYDDFRSSLGDTVPISPDGSFSHLLKGEYTDEFEIILVSDVYDGAFNPAVIYTDSDSLWVEIDCSQERLRSSVTGSNMTDERHTFDTLEYEQFYPLYEEVSNTETDPDRLASKIDSLLLERFKWQFDYFSGTPTVLGLSKYYSLISNFLVRSSEIVEMAKHIRPHHEFWMQAFPNHPLAAVTDKVYLSLITVQVGGEFRDITIQTDDHHLELSEVVKENKYVLLDLWSPWCGSCIKKSKEVRQHYADLNDSGLEVVSICGGVDTEEKFEQAVERFDYPWTVYPEISNQNLLWFTYGIPRAGGQQFLIDQDGKIVMISPSIDELLTLLE
jgi:peroxiredoxin